MEDGYAFAFATLERHTDYPAVYVEIYEALKKLREKAPARMERFSEQLLAVEMEKLEIHGEAYLKLVTNREYQDAYKMVLECMGRALWHTYTGRSVRDLVTPQYRDVTDIVAKWVADGYRQLAALKDTPNDAAKLTRRGYKKEMNAWMKRESIPDLEAARRKLGKSIDTLKSIRSSKGRLRCSEETLKDVLKKIGYLGD